MGTSPRRLLLALGGAIAAFLVAMVFIQPGASDASGEVQQAPTVATTPPAAPLPLPSTASSGSANTSDNPESQPATTGASVVSTISPSVTSKRSAVATMSRSSASAHEPTRGKTPKKSLLQVVPPANTPFALDIRSSSGKLVASANVDPFHAKVVGNAMDPVDPPDYGRAVWVQDVTFSNGKVYGATYPSFPTNGTTFVYGHACHHHPCPFGSIGPDGVYRGVTPETVSAGDLITITTSTGVLTYRVSRVGISPKGGVLPGWASSSTVPNRLVVVTCQYEEGDTSLNNVVVTATLVASTSR